MENDGRIFYELWVFLLCCGFSGVAAVSGNIPLSQLEKGITTEATFTREYGRRSSSSCRSTHLNMQNCK